MANLIRAEWLKLTKRPLLWILLGVSLLLQTLQVAGQAMAVLMVQAGLVAAEGPSVLPFDVYRSMLEFPGIFGAPFVHVNGLGGVFAVILTAGAVGGEYSWGTLRTLLARQPDRIMFMLGKLAALLLLLMSGILITLVYGTALGWLLGTAVGSPGSPDAAALTTLPVAVLRALYVLLPYVLLTTLLTIWGRSLLLGLGGGLAYLVLEAGISALAVLAALGGLFRWLYNLTIVQNITALASLNTRAFGIQGEQISAALRPEALPSPLQAYIVVALYSGLFLAAALHLFFRRDVTGPA